MTVIVCKSPNLARELAEIAGITDSYAFPPASAANDSVARDRWLSERLARNDISLVLYEPKYFVDPAPFRAQSPKTRFVVISGPGDEDAAKASLGWGALATIEKPLVPSDVRGVLSLVSH